MTLTSTARKPWTVERHDQEDGSISYEVWDTNPDSYRRVVSLNDHANEEGRNAKRDAYTIAAGSALAAPTIAPPAVCVLEWNRVKAGLLYADGYKVSQGVGYCHLNWHDGWVAISLGQHSNIEAAQVAADEHRAARIRSAIIPAKPAGVVDDALRKFAESFHFTVTDSFYSDAYLGIHEPDAVTFRLGNGSQFSKHIAKLEARRLAALQGATDGGSGS